MYPNKHQDDEHVDTQTRKGKTVSKRSAGPSNTGNERRKVRRISAGQGMANVANSVETAIDSLKDIATGNAGTSQSVPRLEATILFRAIKAIEKDEGFSDNELKDALLAIEKNPQLAEMYLSLERKGTRALYLRHHMDGVQNYE